MATKMMKKDDMKKEKMPKGKAGIAIMIGLGKPKMSTGGATKKMATGGMPMVNPQQNQIRQINAAKAAFSARQEASSKMATPKMAILTKTPGATASAPIKTKPMVQPTGPTASPPRSLDPTMMAKGGMAKKGK
jgi:hypothetical protein